MENQNSLRPRHPQKRRLLALGYIKYKSGAATTLGLHQREQAALQVFGALLIDQEQEPASGAVQHFLSDD
jgi:hypothetical protein